MKLMQPINRLKQPISFYSVQVDYKCSIKLLNVFTKLCFQKLIQLKRYHNKAREQEKYSSTFIIHVIKH